MRKLILTTIFSLTSILFYAQDIKEVKGRVVANIDSLGIITSFTEEVIGQIKSNGDVMDANDDLIGTIDGDDFKDVNSSVIGSINTSGEVFDSNDMKIGSIIDELTIKDINNTVIATASEAIDKKWLAAYYFFYFNNRY